MDNIIIVGWSIWKYETNVIFKTSKIKLTHIINLVVKLFYDISYYNMALSIFFFKIISHVFLPIIVVKSSLILTRKVLL